MHLLDFADISPSPGRHGSHLSGNAATEGVHPLGIRQIFTILSSHHGMDDRAIQGDSVRRLFHNFVRPMFNFCMIHAIPLIFRAFRKKKKKDKSHENKIVPVLQIRLYNFFCIFTERQLERKVFIRRNCFSQRKFIEYLYPIFSPFLRKGVFSSRRKFPTILHITFHSFTLLSTIDRRGE